MPTTHYCFMDKEQAISLFVIASTKTMNVRAIINQYIRVYTNNHHLSYLFPQQIIALCAKAKVAYPKSEILFQSDELLTLICMSELTSGEKGTQRDRRIASSSKSFSKR